MVGVKRREEIEYALGYEPHPTQVEFHRSRARYRVLAHGRGWGKDRGSINDTLWDLPGMIVANRGKGLVPGVNIWFVAPTYPVSEQTWAELKEFTPRGIVEGVSETDRCIRCKGGAEIWIKSADAPERLVGVGLDRLVMTEAAMTDEEAWQVSLRPTLSRAGRLGTAIFNSTPKGLNWFYKMYLRGQDPLDREVQSWNYPSWYNPTVWSEKDLRRAVGEYTERGEAEKRLIEGLKAGRITVLPAEIEAAKQELPESVFRQEYGAEFLAEAGQVFHHVDGCVQGVLEGPREGHSYVMGVDLGKHEDFTVLVVADRGTRRVTAFERFGQLDYVLQKERIVFLARTYNNASSWVDSTGVGDPIVEDLARMGVTVEGYGISGKSKKPLIDGLAIALEQELLRFPPIPQLISELKAYEYETTKAGNIRMGAPSGYHDDCVIALALCQYGLGQLGQGPSEAVMVRHGGGVQGAAVMEEAVMQRSGMRGRWRRDGMGRRRRL